MNAYRCISAGVILSCLFGFQAAAKATDRSAGAAQNAASAGERGNSVEVIKSKRVAPEILSEFSKVDVVPDGNLEKKFWSGVSRVRFDEAAFTRRKYPKAETMVASRWTAKYLYLAFWCRYQTLNTYKGENPTPERAELWEKDVVEAFINPRPARPSHYYEFEVAPTNQWLDLEIDLERKPFGDAKWNSGFEHATRIDPAHHVWTAEMRIPVRSMTVEQISPGAEWRLNFYRADGPGAGDARRELSWGAVPREVTPLFHQPDSFGTIRFVHP